MKQNLPVFIISLLVFFAWHPGELKATPERMSGTETTNLITTADGFLNLSTDYPCYPPNWTYTFNITETSATWQWENCNGANGYYIQWRYANGTWHDIPGMCYQNWYTCNNLDPSTNYEWRCRANCGYNYYSDWCYPVYFTTNGYHCNYPEWLSCYNITEYSATWKWAGCYGADYYWIQWRYAGGSWYDLYGCPVYGTWVNVNELQPCTSYEYRVKSHCYSGWSNWCNSYGFSTSCNNCPVPYGLITKDIGDKQATLKWSAVYGAYSYSIQLRDGYGNWYDLPGSPSTGTWIIAYNLTPCHTYSWRIRANCGHYDSYGYWSSPQTFTTTCGYGCGAPQWVYTSGITNSSAALHWEQVSGASYYVVEWRAAGGPWNQLQGGPWTNTSAELTGLQTNTTYEWHVKTYCTDGRTSDWSSITSFNTLGEECGLPFFRYTLPVTDSTATFNWTAVDGVLNYSIQYRLANGAWIDVPGSPTTDLSITVTGLLPDTLYEWSMKVNCSNGSSSKWLASLMFHTSNTSGCNKPGGLFVDSLTLTSARLNWSQVQDAESYSVQIRVWPNGSWNTVTGSPVDTNFIVVDSLLPNTTYEWQVRTNCSGGFHSFYANGYHFMTTDLPSCSAPDHLTADLINETSATLHWSAVPGALGYKGQIRLPNGAYIDVGGLMTDTFVVVSGLTPNTTYDWHVKTKCSDDHFSNWSSTASFTTTGNGVPNDECANAIVLTVNDTCVSTFASNVDATPSVPSPVGGCSSIGNKDVWFKFTMPNVLNPNVTIRTSAGSLANAVMEVYSGTDCNILSVITCEDNNDNGNGSLMPVINLTGTAGVTIWVRVWGFEGATGTFTICLLDHVTFNYAGVPHVVSSEAGEVFDNAAEIVQAPVDMDDQPQMQIIPNPVRDQLNVIVRQTEECRVIGLRLLDYSGKVMISKENDLVRENQFKTRVDVSALAPGMYVMQVQTTSGMMVEKVTVVR